MYMKIKNVHIIPHKYMYMYILKKNVHPFFFNLPRLRGLGRETKKMVAMTKLLAFITTMSVVPIGCGGCPFSTPMPMIHEVLYWPTG